MWTPLQGGCAWGDLGGKWAQGPPQALGRAWGQGQGPQTSTHAIKGAWGLKPKGLGGLKAKGLGGMKPKG